jgi:hypothetical protein
MASGGGTYIFGKSNPRAPGRSAPLASARAAAAASAPSAANPRTPTSGKPRPPTVPPSSGYGSLVHTPGAAPRRGGGMGRRALCVPVGAERRRRPRCGRRVPLQAESGGLHPWVPPRLLAGQHRPPRDAAGAGPDRHARAGAGRVHVGRGLRARRHRRGGGDHRQGEWGRGAAPSAARARGRRLAARRARRSLCLWTRGCAHGLPAAPGFPTPCPPRRST